MKIKYLLIILVFLSCKSNSDERLNKLNLEKATLEDSLRAAEDKAKDYAFRRIYDSAQKAIDAEGYYKSKIKDVEKSIDSLTGK